MPSWSIQNRCIYSCETTTQVNNSAIEQRNQMKIDWSCVQLSITMLQPNKIRNNITPYSDFRPSSIVHKFLSIFLSSTNSSLHAHMIYQCLRADYQDTHSFIWQAYLMKYFHTFDESFFFFSIYK